MIIDKEFLGVGDFIWWIGIVESVSDPMELGRCKVRIFGLHGDKSKVPTDKLPWANPIMPVISASHEGHGWSPTGLEPGSWVIGFFLDGKRGQFPVIWGSFHGVQATANLRGIAAPGGGGQVGQGTGRTAPYDMGAGAPTAGSPEAPAPINPPGSEWWEESQEELFGIPSNTRTETPPAQQGSMDNVLNAAPTHVEELQTQQEARRIQFDTGGDRSKWATPPTPDQTAYPWAQVWQSKDGETKVMMDGTPNAEMFKIYHKSGTIYQIDVGGNLRMQSEGDTIHIAKRNLRAGTLGDYTITSGGNSRFMAQKEMAIESGGAISVKAGTSWAVRADGPVSVHTSGDLILQGSSVKVIASAGSIDMRSAKEHVNIQAGQEVNISAGLSQDVGGGGTGINIDTPGIINMNTSEKLQLNADKEINIQAPEMSIHSEHSLHIDHCEIDECKIHNLSVDKQRVDSLDWVKTRSTSFKTIIAKTLGDAYVGEPQPPQFDYQLHELLKAKELEQQERGTPLKESTEPPDSEKSAQSPAGIARQATASPAATPTPTKGVLPRLGEDLAPAPTTSSSDLGIDAPFGSTPLSGDAQ